MNWTGYNIDVSHGGTGNSSFSNVNSIVLSGSTTTSGLVSLYNGLIGQILSCNGVGNSPSWINANTMSYDTIYFVGTQNYISTTLPNNLIMVYDCNTIYPNSNNFVFEISSVQANNMNVIRMPNFTASSQIRGVQYTSVAIWGYNSERIYTDLIGGFTMSAYGLLAGHTYSVAYFSASDNYQNYGQACLLCIDYGLNTIPLKNNMSAYLFQTSSDPMNGDFILPSLSQGSNFYITDINAGNMSVSTVTLHSSNSNTIEGANSKIITTNTHYLYLGGGTNGTLTKLN